MSLQHVSPTFYFSFSAVPNSLRVNTALRWLANSTGTIPDLVVLYFSQVDEMGHEGGTRSRQVDYIKDLTLGVDGI